MKGIILALFFIASSAFGAIRWDRAEITYSDDCPRRFKGCVDGCFRQWGDASLLVFRRVASGGDIRIIWSKRKGLGNYLSFTTISFSGERILSASVTINAREWRWHEGKPFGSFLRYQRRGIGEITGVLAHEFGHALGLIQHSSNPDDTMFEMIHAGAETLSEGDVAAIRELYR